MEVIPVIDVRGGVVVRADNSLAREDYPALHSPLCPDAAPGTLLATLTRAAGIRSVYIADLDALSGQPAQWPLITCLAGNYPFLELWVDAGFRTPRDVAAMPVLHNVVPVIGSETWQEGPPGSPLAGRCILSLDSRAGDRVGVGRLHLPQPRAPGLRVILMSLDRMGHPAGPDLQRLAHARAEAADVHWMVAGGIRHLADVHAVAALGGSGVLSATALHSGHIPIG